MNKNPEQSPKGGKKLNMVLRLLALAVTAVLMLGALFLVIHREDYNLDALKSWITRRSLTADGGTGEVFSYAGGSKQSLALLEDGVLFASDAGAHYYSLSGQLYAEAVQPLENPVLAAGRKVGAVYDAGGKDLHLYHRGEESFSLTLPGDGDLLSVRVNDGGWLAVTAQTSGYKGGVTVYDDQGEKVISVNLSSTFAVDAALSPDRRQLAVVTMGQSSGAFESRIQLYPLSGEEPTQSWSLAGSAVLDLDYENDRIWVLGEDRLTILDQDGIAGEYSFGRSYLKGCALGGDGFALVLLGRYRAGAATQAVVVAPDGTPVTTLELREQVLSFDAAGDFFALLTGNALTLYTSQGEVSATLEDTRAARYVALDRGGAVLLATQQEAWLYQP